MRRYVPGPALDEPIVWYEGSGTSDRRWLLADPLGSVIAVSNGAGTATTINAYDEYGQPGAANAGRFQYAGALADIARHSQSARCRMLAVRSMRSSAALEQVIEASADQDVVLAATRMVRIAKNAP